MRSRDLILLLTAHTAVLIALLAAMFVT